MKHKKPATDFLQLISFILSFMAWGAVVAPPFSSFFPPTSTATPEQEGNFFPAPKSEDSLWSRHVVSFTSHQLPIAGHPFSIKCVLFTARFGAGFYGQRGRIKIRTRTAPPTNLLIFICTSPVAAQPHLPSLLACCCWCSAVRVLMDFTQGFCGPLCEIHEDAEHRKASQVSLKGGIDCN